MQLHEGIRRHTQVVEALLWVSRIEVHPLSPRQLQEGDCRVDHWSRLGHCCFVPCKRDNSSNQVENVWSVAGNVAAVGLLTDAHLQDQIRLLYANLLVLTWSSPNSYCYFLNKWVNEVANTNLQIGLGPKQGSILTHANLVQMKGLHVSIVQ